MCRTDQYSCARSRPFTLDFYRPQTKLREGNLFTPVCQSFCSQGDVHGRRSVHGRGCAWQGTCVAGGGMRGGGVWAGEMATEAGGTHPTGMHSCYGNILSVVAHTSLVPTYYATDILNSISGKMTFCKISLISCFIIQSQIFFFISTIFLH